MIKKLLYNRAELALNDRAERHCIPKMNLIWHFLLFCHCDIVSHISFPPRTPKITHRIGRDYAREKKSQNRALRIQEKYKRTSFSSLILRGGIPCSDHNPLCTTDLCRNVSQKKILPKRLRQYRILAERKNLVLKKLILREFINFVLILL